MTGFFFADSFFWIAIAHPRDAFHFRAIAWQRANPRARLVTTEEVLAEVLNWFARLGPKGRLSAADLVADLVADVVADPLIQVLPQTSAEFLAALAFYKGRLDKDYSLVDCRSMAAMMLLGISEVLTNDPHFTQEGFTILFP